MGGVYSSLKKWWRGKKEAKGETTQQSAPAQEQQVETTVVDVQTAAEWQPQEYHFIRGDVRLADKRRFHAIEESPYPLPADLQEQDRLELQHILYRNALGRLYFSPVDELLESGAALVADIGCGPGAWVRDVAQRNPKSKFIGVDMAASLFEGVETPVNVEFTTGNVLDRLPFADNTFDLVYMRLLFLAIPKDKWVQVIKELVRITKPGGFVELCEPTEFQSLGPQYTKQTMLTRKIMEARGLNFTAGYDIATYLDEAGCLEVREGTRSIPIGWGGKLGEYMVINLREAALAAAPLLKAAMGMDPEVYSAEVNASFVEAAEFKSYYNIAFAYGQVPNPKP